MKKRNAITGWMYSVVIAVCTVVLGLAVLGNGSNLGGSGTRASTVAAEEFWMLGCTDMVFIHGQDRAAVVSDGSIYFQPFWLKGRTLVKIVPWEGGSMSMNRPQDILAPGAPDPQEFPTPFPGCIKEGTLYWDQYQRDKKAHDDWLANN